MQSFIRQQVQDLLQREDLIFPTSVRNALQIRHLLLDPDSDISTITTAIRKDPIISLSILRLINSPMYAVRTNDISNAVSLLGFSALNFLVFGLIQKQLNASVPYPCGKPIQYLWQYSLDVASSSYAIALTNSTRAIADESVLLSMILHLDLMFAVYATCQVTHNLQGTNYYVFLRRTAHENRIRLLTMYGVTPEVMQILSVVYWPYDTEHLTVPLTSCETLTLALSSVVVPENLTGLIPLPKCVNQLTAKQQEIKMSVQRSLSCF